MNHEEKILSIEKYRALTKDQTSTDEQISKRLEYIRALCRNVIRMELEKIPQLKRFYK